MVDVVVERMDGCCDVADAEGKLRRCSRNLKKAVMCVADSTERFIGGECST